MSATVRVKVKDRWYTVEVGDLRSSPVQVVVDGDPVEVSIDRLVDGGNRDRLEETETASTPAPAVGQFSSPMPGVIISVAVHVGDQVVTGDEICVLEAMKMQQTLRADWSGIVRAVYVSPGKQVLEGDPIVELE